MSHIDLFRFSLDEKFKYTPNSKVQVNFEKVTVETD